MNYLYSSEKVLEDKIFGGRGFIAFWLGFFLMMDAFHYASKSQIYYQFPHQ